MVETSLVVRAFNEERFLGPLLAAVRRQAYTDFEIIVVDSHSNDRTQEIAREHADKVVQVERHDFTFGHSLNAGVQAASGRLIGIVSAHTLPVDDAWLGNLLAPFDDDATAMVYGRQVGHDLSKFSECRDFEETFGREARVMTPPNFFANNANSAVRRSLWEEHRFDETLPGLEDIEWAKHWMERGKRVVYEPTAAIHHIHTETWKQVRNRYYREAVAAKWIGTTRRRDVPREAAREARRFVQDVAHAGKTGVLAKRAQEIARFRWNKLAGTVAGTLDGARMDNPMGRDSLYFDKPYRAVRVTGANKATLDDVVPTPLRPGEVMIRVAFTGVCATDLDIYRGRLGYYRDGLASYPIVLGHEVSGVVADVGNQVTEVAKGDRVVIECIQNCGTCGPCERGRTAGCERRTELGVMGRDGGYAEFLTTPARFVHRIPERLSLQEAALAEPMAVVMKALRRLERTWDSGPTERRIAVVGAGTIGQLAARELAARGHHVEVFDRDPRRLAALDGTKVKGAATVTDLAPFDAVIEATGDPAALEQVLEKSAAGATLLLLGMAYARRAIDFERIVGFDKTVVGSVGSAAEDFEAALQALPRLDLAPFTAASFPLERFRDAWAAAEAREHLKVMLRPDAPEA